MAVAVTFKKVVISLGGYSGLPLLMVSGQGRFLAFLVLLITLLLALTPASVVWLQRRGWARRALLVDIGRSCSWLAGFRCDADGP